MISKRIIPIIIVNFVLCVIPMSYVSGIDECIISETFIDETVVMKPCADSDETSVSDQPIEELIVRDADPNEPMEALKNIHRSNGSSKKICS